MPKSGEHMEVDGSDGSNGQQSPPKEKPLVLVTVPGCSSGDGLPYAPEGWPNPGDVWKWRVGNRKTVSGHWVDRFLYPPKRFQHPPFASKLSVEQFIKMEFPGEDVDEFFASFVWRIPAGDYASKKDERSGSELTPGAEYCKAGNKICYQRSKEKSETLPAEACDICCSEKNFCRDCCCILCCKTIEWAYEGYSFIRCEASVDERFICGHVAHLDCALHSYMAGTVGGIIGLDVEYYCRRCDKKTDLMAHVTKLFKTCETVTSREDIEKLLNLGLCILRNSDQTRAKNLHNSMGVAMAKLKNGVVVQEIWKEEDNIATFSTG